MSMFTLAISCLTTSNLPWFMDLTFQVPIQYCSLQHQTLLLSLVTSTTGCWFSFGSILSFFLELFSPLISSSILGTYQPGQFIFQCPSFCLFMLFMGFSRQEYWSGLPFPSPVDHIPFSSGPHSLLQWTTSKIISDGYKCYQENKAGYKKIENDGGVGGDTFRSGGQAKYFEGTVFQLWPEYWEGKTYEIGNRIPGKVDSKHKSPQVRLSIVWLKNYKEAIM